MIINRSHDCCHCSKVNPIDFGQLHKTENQISRDCCVDLGSSGTVSSIPTKRAVKSQKHMTSRKLFLVNAQQ